jgi:ribose 5-phosphate isomerase B
MAEMSRQHNNSNVLALGARVTEEGLALRIVQRWLESSFEGGRHQRRIDRITAIENGEDITGGGC